MAKSQALKDVSTPSEYTSFLKFADRLNIPINQDYLNHIREKIGCISFDLNAIDVGVKDSKTHEKFDDRRIQNALWRAWWRQRCSRFNTGQKRHKREDEQVVQEMNFLWGREIGDIPTEYTIPDLEAHELPVIGTYVDPHVIPGFSYRVRVCGYKQNNYLFDGKSMRLDRVGVGYGKRLTFEDQDILVSDNFFWSDSNPDGGFAFSMNVLCEGERFKIFDSLDREVGKATVTRVDPRQQVHSSETEDSETTAKVCVDFECNITFIAESFVPRGKDDAISVSGIVKMVKTPQSKSAVIAEINGVIIPDLGLCVFYNV